MANTELLQLIDLSLGGEPPCGVVNFNNMHTLLHEIVRRLLQLEGFVISNSTPLPTVEGGATYMYPPHGAGSTAEPIVMMSKSTSVSPVKRSSIAVSTSKQGDVSASKQVDNRNAQVAAGGGGKPSTSPCTTPADIAAASIKKDTPQEDQVTSIRKQKIVTDGADSRDAVIAKGEDEGEENVQPVTTADAAVAKKPSNTDVAVATSKEMTDGEETKIMQEFGTQLSGDIAAIGQTSPVGTSVSHMSIRHPSTASSVGAYHIPVSRSRPHVITASNDLVAMERKITELENRLGTVEALPDLLERKGANAMATPVKDLWNFTSLTKRVDAAEDGIHKVK